MNTIVTTSLKQDRATVARAQSLASHYKLAYVERQNQPLRRLLKQGASDGALIVYADDLIYENYQGSQLRFHPDTAMLRVKSPRDPLIELIGTGRKTVLDTTMGLASDSLVMAAAEHEVTALESQFLIYLVVSQGLKTYLSGNAELDAAMRSIKTYCQDSTTYLKSLPDNAFDIVYTDPMFSEEISEAKNLDALRPLANNSPLTEAFLKEAKRVAQQKVILKAHFRDTVFETFGFERLVRPNQKFHYGALTLSKGGRS